ncbi:unnamed protein product [Meloidogyne enterolobii]|uniref:Uncharacterized protein n=1 Tax=Meloidogyne enterolobii TaxID=390850 RepID=A0ACB0ZJV0_MELEN
MVNTLKERNQLFGFIARKNHWQEITGNTKDYNNIPLLYFHMDSKNNFNDYYEHGYPFGGWRRPTMKGYEDEEICGVNVTDIYSDKKLKKNPLAL